MSDYLDLGEQVLDKGIVSADGRRSGKVDDLLLEVDDDDMAKPPRVVGVLTGPGALAEDSARPIRMLARLFYRLLGVSRPEPTLIPWNKVTRIGVVVEIGLDRREAGLEVLNDAVSRRFIGRLPGG